MAKANFHGYYKAVSKTVDTYGKARQEIDYTYMVNGNTYNFHVDRSNGKKCGHHT